MSAEITDWDLVNLLDDVSAALETVLTHLQSQMTPADRKARWALCRRARGICDRLLRANKAKAEED